MRLLFEARCGSANGWCRAAAPVHAHAFSWVLSLDSFPSKTRLSVACALVGHHAPVHTTVREVVESMIIRFLCLVSPVRRPALAVALRAAASSSRCALLVLDRLFVQLGSAIASNRQKRRRTCVVEVGFAVVTAAALAWLVSRGCTPELVPAERRPATGIPQLSRGSVGGRGNPDIAAEGMLCHHARACVGFCVRGMMLCHRASSGCHV